MANSWTNSFWDCFSPIDTCLMGCFCPCFLFGTTQARNKGEVDPSGFNMDCCAWYCLLHCGATPCLQAIKRSDMRSKFNLDGSCVGDWAKSCCCHCCALIQEEKESLLRSGEKQQMGYQAPQGMTYQPGAPQDTTHQYGPQGHQAV